MIEEEMSSLSIRQPNEEERAIHRAALDTSIDALYAAFNHHQLSSGGPDVCTVCCMSPEAKLRISIAPKPAITDEDLSDFHSAAKGENAGQDLAYFLPRTMESVANGHELSAGLFSLFSTYFPPVWPTLRHEEQTAVNDFYATLTRWLLTADESDKRVLPISDVIEMCASGGFDVEPIFSVLANPPITSTTINALSQLILYGAHLWQNEKNSFFEVPQDRAEQIARSLANSLSSPEVLSLLETAALQDDDEALADLASTAHVIMESIST